MDVEGRVWIDMAPNNVVSPTLARLRQEWQDGHPEDEPRPWRDHWMQALYFLSGKTVLTRGQTATVLASHDDYSLAFDLSTESKDQIGDLDAFQSSSVSLAPPILSRTKLGFLNCEETKKKFARCLQKVIRPDSIVCCVGEGSMLPIICATLGAKKVSILVSDWFEKKKKNVITNSV